MATATVEHPPANVRLELTEEEAQALLTLLQHASGCIVRQNNPALYGILDAFEKAGLQ